MLARKFFNLTMALILVLSFIPGTATAQTSQPEAKTQTTQYLVTLPLPEVQIPTGTPANRVPGYYQIALQQAWSKTEALLSAMQQAGLVESYKLLAEQNAFEVTAAPAAVDQLARVGSVQASDAASLVTGDGQQFQVQLQTAVQGAQRQERSLEPAAARVEPPPLQTFYVILEPEQAAKENALSAVGNQLAAFEQDSIVAGFEWRPELNAFQVNASRDMRMLAELPGVLEVSSNKPDRMLSTTLLAQPDTASLDQTESITATDASMPAIEAFVNTTHLYLVSTSNLPVVLTLYNSIGVQKNIPAYTNFFGWYFNGTGYTANAFLYDSTWYGTQMEPGDRLHVVQEGQTAFEIEIPELYASVRRDTDTVYGTGPAGITSTDPAVLPVLQVVGWGINTDSEGGESGSAYVTTDANGAFSTQLDCAAPDTCTLDLRADTNGQLIYTDVNGNRAVIDYLAPTLYATLYSSFVSGYVERSTAVSLSLLNPAGVIKASFESTAESDGYFSGTLKDVYENSVSVQPGDQILLEGALGATITIDAVAIGAVGDINTDILSGSGPVDPNAADNIFLPSLYASGPGGSTYLVPDTNGNFTTGALGDLRPGSSINITYYTAEADQLRYSFIVPQIFVRGVEYGYTSDNHVSGGGYPGLVQVNLLRSGSTLATAYSNSEGAYLGVDFSDIFGQPVNIQGGDEIEVIHDLVTTNLIVPAFSELESDGEDDEVTGNTNAVVTTTDAFANQSLVVYPQSLNYWGIGKSILPDATGDLLAENPFYQYANPANGDTILDIYPGNHGHLRYIDAAGHYVYEDFTTPSPDPVVIVRGSVNGNYVSENYVSGIVTGACSSEVDITVRDSAGVLKGYSEYTYACPTFEAYIYDVYGSGILISAGDSVEVSYRGATTLVEVPAFNNLFSDIIYDAVSGSTDALVTSTTYGTVETLAVYPQSLSDGGYGKYVAPDTAGDFSAQNPFYASANPLNGNTSVDIASGDRGHLRYIDAQGNRVYTTFTALDSPTALTIAARGSYDYYHADNFVRVTNNACGSVDVLLKDHAGVEKAALRLYACNTAYGWFERADGAPVNILPGDRVEATYNGVTTVLEVPEFEVTSSSVTDSLSGSTNAVVTSTTPNGLGTLAVFPQSLDYWAYGKYIVPDAAGDFTAENPFYFFANPSSGSTNVDIRPGNVGHLRYTGADGNQVYDDFASLYLQPQLNIQKDSNWLNGFWTAGETALQISLSRLGSEIASRALLTDRYGYFEINLYDASGTPAIIQESDILTVSDGVTTEIVDVPHLTAQADPFTETVSGEAPPDSPLSVSVFLRTVPAVSDSSGAYSASFLGIQDLRAGNQYWIDYRNPDGHSIYITSYIGPKVTSLLNSNSVWGIGTAPDQEVSVALLRGGEEIAWDTATTSSNNSFNAYLYTANGQAAQIQAGDQITVEPANGSSLSMTAADLSAEVDAAADLISGTGPAGELLHVEVGSPSFAENVTPDATGAWQIDPGAVGCNLLPGAHAFVQHADSPAIETWLYANAPVIYVRGTSSASTAYLSDNYISGYTASLGPVEVSLERDGEMVAQRLTNITSSTGFGVYLYDDLDNPVTILGGDIVRVNDITVLVPEIQAVLDADANIISGYGPPNAQFGMYVSYPADQSRTITTAADGSFSTSFGEIYSDTYANIRYSNPDGNWIHARFKAVQTYAVQIMARWNYTLSSVCDSCVSGYNGNPYAPVHLSLLRAGTVIAEAVDRSDDSSRFFGQFKDSDGAIVAIQAGDEIELLSGSVTTSMTVAALTAQINRESGVLFGQGPAAGRVYSDRAGWIDIDLDGNYYADIGAKSGYRGAVYTPDVDGHHTYVGWVYPAIFIRANSNMLYGYVDPNVPVLVQLFASSGKLKASAETISYMMNGSFEIYFTNLQGDPILILPGDTLAVSASPTIQIIIPEVTAVVDKAGDRVEGLAPPDSQLTVYAYTNAHDQVLYPIPAANGTYIADFSDFLDLKGGDYVGLEAEVADGVYLWLETHVPMLNVNTANNIVNGYNTAMADLSLALVRGGSTIASTETETSDWDGFFTAFFTDAQGKLVDILPGDRVRATALTTESLTSVAITAEIDPVTDTVSGTGPANARLLVKAFVWFLDTWGMEEYYDYESVPVYTNAAGEFTVDFSSSLPLDNTSHVYIEYQGSTGNVSSYNTMPQSLPAEEIVAQWITASGAKLSEVYTGVANQEDITPPISFQSPGDDIFILAYYGDLIITAPDGSVYETNSDYFTLEDAGEGVWQIQMRKYGTDGSPYAIAIGVIPPYRIFAPAAFSTRP